jgi:hypothetical protein
LLSASVTPGAAQEPPARVLYDDVLASVTVPGFAGVWVDGGELVVALTRPSRAGMLAARRGVAEALARPDLAAMPVRAAAARYSFRALKSWHDALLPDLPAVVVMTDVDERANVVRIGMTDPSLSLLAGALARHGVPANAVAVVRDAAVTATSLDDNVRPVVGGVRIDSEIKTCTLGFNATLNGVKGFVTNSHCTDVQGGVESTNFYQTLNLLPPDLALVAVETVDPSYGTGLVRESDSAFADLVDDAYYAQGVIAKPSTGTAWNGTDAYHVTSKRAPVLGETVYKVGRTTGRTSASVTATCANYVQHPPNPLPGVGTFRMTCQASANLGAMGGDSGSPVFAITSGDDVALVGILWGGSTFSPIGNVENELGTLSVCYTGTC